MNTDWKKLALFPAGYPRRCAGKGKRPESTGGCIKEKERQRRKELN